MLFFLLPLIFQFPGIRGNDTNKEDFRFCADRKQTEKGHVHYEMQKNISIVNRVDGLDISAPFPPDHPSGSKTCALPKRLGSYRFCAYWFQDARLFILSYGGTNYTLSTQANYPLYSPNITGTPKESNGHRLHNVSYAFSKGSHNTSLASSSAYDFTFTDSGKVGPNDLEKVLKQTEEALKKLEAAMRIPDDEEVRGFEVTLPKYVFQRPKFGRRNGKRKVVQLAAKSQILFQGQDAEQILGGKVIGISMGSAPVRDLPKEERVAITFLHKPLPVGPNPSCTWMVVECVDTQSVNGSILLKEELFPCMNECLLAPGRNVTPQCVFWDVEVLMVSSPEIDHVHHKYLTLITYIGCIISAVASFVTVFSFLCSRKRQRDHIVYVHMNLLWAIFLLDMSFLIAVPLAPASGDTGCKAGAMFLHFGVLACLTWMGIEGYCLYRLVIEVFNSYVKHFLLKLCLVGWGLPMFVVSLIFLIDQSYYGPFSLEVYDSLKRPTNATILVLFFNTIMLVAMVREILKLRHRGHHWEYAVMLLGLSCVLGIPWGLAFFAFSSGTFKLVAVYLFTIVNSFQGFLIFLWHLAKVLQSRKSSSMQCSTSNSIKLQSNSTSI
ncbi:hypothetical protein JD844_000108 [Phrynosoma platyrhinos]|uniref:G-protein coupled receptors family 2 profile 2 domain-containing protein n=1 Tax=Phrynosoma platyrhinos TaxID=52577 RepID=A0ABQ7SQA9_PHRPL|nr:hypothetical protein JD844_000108 [Phrynosoma platyrhinos]